MSHYTDISLKAKHEKAHISHRLPSKQEEVDVDKKVRYLEDVG